MRTGVCLRFPNTSLRSFEDFQQFRRENSDLLDERYRREQSLGTKNPAVKMDGTCGLCLEVTSFTSHITGGESTPDGRIVPNWREQQICGCGRFLNGRQRALLHLATPHMGTPDWYKPVILGREDAVTRYLSGLFTDLIVCQRLDEAGAGLPLKLAAADGSRHMVISADYLQFVPPLGIALAEIARVLMPGGVFLFTVPFLLEAKQTHTALPPGMLSSATFSASPVHLFGWDLLHHVRQAGFEDCAAHCYWSEELGYLGTFNLVFVAYR